MVQNCGKRIIFVVNDYLIMIFIPWSIDRYGSFAHFFDDHGRCEPLATKIYYVVDGFHRATKLLMSS
jgi:hypothetical protein